MPLTGMPAGRAAPAGRDADAAARRVRRRGGGRSARAAGRTARRPTPAARCRTASSGWRSSSRWRRPRRPSGSRSATCRPSRAPGRRRPARRRRRSSHSNLVPLKYGSSTSPVRRRTRSRAPCSASSSHRCAVRRSCQTIAWPYGRPVDRSHATTVSRWLVIPIAATDAGAGSLDDLDQRRPSGIPDLDRVVLDPAGAREVLGELAVRRDAGRAVDRDRTAADPGRAGVDGDHARAGVIASSTSRPAGWGRSTCGGSAPGAGGLPARSSPWRWARRAACASRPASCAGSRTWRARTRATRYSGPLASSPPMIGHTPPRGAGRRTRRS